MSSIGGNSQIIFLIDFNQRNTPIHSEYFVCFLHKLRIQSKKKNREILRSVFAIVMKVILCIPLSLLNRQWWVWRVGQFLLYPRFSSNISHYLFTKWPSWKTIEWLCRRNKRNHLSFCRFFFSFKNNKCLVKRCEKWIEAHGDSITKGNYWNLFVSFRSIKGRNRLDSSYILHD